MREEVADIRRGFQALIGWHIGGTTVRATHRSARHLHFPQIFHCIIQQPSDYNCQRIVTACNPLLFEDGLNHGVYGTGRRRHINYAAKPPLLQLPEYFSMYLQHVNGQRQYWWYERIIYSRTSRTTLPHTSSRKSGDHRSPDERKPAYRSTAISPYKVSPRD